MPSAWQAHLTAYRAAHPRSSYKECMQGASHTYRSNAAKKVRTRQLTLQMLATWVQKHPQKAISVYQKFQKPITTTTSQTMLIPTGRIIKITASGNVRAVATLARAAQDPSKFVGAYVEMQYENGEIAEDENIPVICEKGLLSSNCLTPETSFVRAL